MLDVSADVEIDFGAGRGRLVADGRDVVLEVDDSSALIGVVDRQALKTLAATLSAVGLTLCVRRGDRLLLSAGHGIKSGISSRLLRIPAVRLSPLFALVLAAQRAFRRR